MTERDSVMLTLKLTALTAAALRMLLTIDKSGRPVPPKIQAWVADGQMVVAAMKHEVARDRLRRAATL